MPRKNGSSHSVVKANGPVLHHLRKAQGLSLDELGAQAELSGSFLSRVEQGKSSIGRQEIALIAQRLGQPVSALILSTDQAPPTGHRISQSQSISIYNGTSNGSGRGKVSHLCNGNGNGSGPRKESSLFQRLLEAAECLCIEAEQDHETAKGLLRRARARRESAQQLRDELQAALLSQLGGVKNTVQYHVALPDPVVAHLVSKPDVSAETGEKVEALLTPAEKSAITSHAEQAEVKERAEAMALV